MSDKVHPKMSGYRYSPFTKAGSVVTKRVGVPGHALYPQHMAVLTYWTGSSFQAVLTSCSFWVYMLGLSGAAIAGLTVDYDEWIAGSTVPAGFGSAVSNLCIFMMTFFIGQCFGEATRRFENVCKTNGNVTRLSAIVGGCLPFEEARQLMRWTNAIMHIYYLLLSGPMDEEKWGLLERRELLTLEEIKALQQQGSPAVVIYSWCVHALHSFPLTAGGINMAERTFLELVQPMEQQIGACRGLAAKQIAYTRDQIPMSYFHIVHVAVTVLLMCVVYDTSLMISKAVDGPCIATGKGKACVPKVVVILVTQTILIFLFVGLLKVAQGLSDIYGNKTFQYDLGVDLDNLWTESQNVLKSMSVKCPSLPVQVPAVKGQGNEPQAPAENGQANLDVRGIVESPEPAAVGQTHV